MTNMKRKGKAYSIFQSRVISSKFMNFSHPFKFTYRISWIVLYFMIHKLWYPFRKQEHKNMYTLYKVYVCYVFMTLRNEILLKICAMFQRAIRNKVFFYLGLWSFVFRSLLFAEKEFYPHFIILMWPIRMGLWFYCSAICIRRRFLSYGLLWHCGEVIIMRRVCLLSVY